MADGANHHHALGIVDLVAYAIVTDPHSPALGGNELGGGRRSRVLRQVQQGRFQPGLDVARQRSELTLG